MEASSEKRTEEAKVAQAAEHAETIAALRARAEHQMSTSQRVVETFTANIGRPSTIAMLLALIALWVAWNAIESRGGGQAIDPPPFFWLQGIVGLCALLMTTVVLITQNRQGKLAERREQLDLQMSLLTEQRTAKIIDLLEELRRDMPTVHNRVDLEAEALIKTVDPQEVLAALEIKLEETMETTAAAQIVTDEIDEAAIETEERIRLAQHEKNP